MIEHQPISGSEDRDWPTAGNLMTKRKILLLLSGLVLCVFFIVVVGFLVVLGIEISVNNDGSLPLAQSWAMELRQYHSFEELPEHTEIHSHRFSDEEWIIYRYRDSHGGWEEGGGTLVIHDSTGKTRLLHGHVCDEWYIIEAEVSDLKGLDEFLAVYGFESFQTDR